jgi:hypothetical protein
MMCALHSGAQLEYHHLNGDRLPDACENPYARSAKIVFCLRSVVFLAGGVFSLARPEAVRRSVLKRAYDSKFVHSDASYSLWLD